MNGHVLLQKVWTYSIIVLTFDKIESRGHHHQGDYHQGHRGHQGGGGGGGGGGVGYNLPGFTSYYPQTTFPGGGQFPNNFEFPFQNFFQNNFQGNQVPQTQPLWNQNPGGVEGQGLFPTGQTSSGLLGSGALLGGLLGNQFNQFQPSTGGQGQFGPNFGAWNGLNFRPSDQSRLPPMYVQRPSDFGGQQQPEIKCTTTPPKVSLLPEVPIEEVEIPAEEVTIPIEEVKIPVEEVKIPAEEVTIPVEEVTIPVEKVKIPAEVNLPAPVSTQDVNIAEQEVNSTKDEVNAPAQIPAPPVVTNSVANPATPKNCDDFDSLSDDDLLACFDNVLKTDQEPTTNNYNPLDIDARVNFFKRHQ